MRSSATRFVFTLSCCILLWMGMAEPHSQIVSDLLRDMPLEHKIGQMMQLDISMIIKWGTAELDIDRLRELVDTWRPGSFLNSPFSGGSIQYRNRTATGYTECEWRELRAQIDAVYRNASGPGPRVPIVYGLDSVHGANYVEDATVFPQQLNLAATFNPEVAEAVGAATAADTRAAGVEWVFAPILGIAVQPAWPRVYETFGEDPLLASLMGAATIRGLQGRGAGDMAGREHVAACMKHFVGYSNPRSGHDRSPSWLPARVLYQHFVPPFAAAVRAGAATAMESYNDVNGSPVAASGQYLRRLLRDALGFEGMLVTDWAEIQNLHTWHHVAASEREAVRLSLSRTSIDMSMVPLDTRFAGELASLVRSGEISEARVDESVGRILQLKHSLGLLGPAPAPAPPERGAACRRLGRARALTLQAAGESLVLLRNVNGTLPLEGSPGGGGGREAVVVLGPTAANLRAQIGGWTRHWQGLAEGESVTTRVCSEECSPEEVGEDPTASIVGGMRRVLASRSDLSDRYILRHSNVSFPAGASAAAERGRRDAEAVLERQLAVASVSTVVVCLGEERPYTEMPGNIRDPYLPEHQLRLLAAALASNKRVVLVLVEGRVRALTPQSVEEEGKGTKGGLAGVAAVLHAGLPGPAGGLAVARALFGLADPSGRLPVSYPRHAHGGPIQYWHAVTEKQADFEFEFGDGQSYTRFEYSDLAVEPPRVQPGQPVHVSLQVRNTGPRAGADVVQLFVSQHYRSVTPEGALLKAFRKLHLDPGTSTTVRLQVDTGDLAYVDAGLKWVVEAGNFTVLVRRPNGERGHIAAPLQLLPGPAPAPMPPGEKGGVIPWGMWGLPPGYQLPLPGGVQAPVAPDSSVEPLAGIIGPAGLGFIFAAFILGAVAGGLCMRECGGKLGLLGEKGQQYLEMVDRAQGVIEE